MGGGVGSGQTEEFSAPYVDQLGKLRFGGGEGSETGVPSLTV